MVYHGNRVLATCFFVRRFRIRRERPRSYSNGMSSRLVKAMPSQIFSAVVEDNRTSMTCAICLEDYSVGEKLRILPCRHKYHAMCVDSWLTSWRTFCPMCKRDARTSTGDPPASKSTPLLSSGPSSSALSRTPSVSRIPSHRSYYQSPAPSVSHSSRGLRHVSSQRSIASHLSFVQLIGLPVNVTSIFETSFTIYFKPKQCLAKFRKFKSSVSPASL